MPTKKQITKTDRLPAKKNTRRITTKSNNMEDQHQVHKIVKDSKKVNPAKVFEKPSRY